MRYRFLDCFLDTSCHELACGGNCIKLQPKAFQLLAFLIETRDRVVTKTELFEKLWPARVVGDASLVTCIKDIRKAVGDTGHDQRIIKTFHGSGYRFVAEVRVDPPFQLIQGQVESVVLDEDSTEVPRVKLQATVAGSEDGDFPSQTAHRNFGKENKMASVLWCNLVDADQLAGCRAAEAFDLLMQNFFEVAQRIVERHDGKILVRLDDGFVALFGAPVATDDHARRAVLAGFELSAELQVGGFLAPLNGPAELAVRMAVHSGPMIVNVEDWSSEAGSPVGTTMQAARRLQQLAKRADLLVSETSYRTLVNEIEAEPLGSKVDGETPYRAIGIRHRRAGVPQRTRSALAPLIGRERESGILRDRLARARDGQGQVVCLIGEAGIGKTRLLHEFLHDSSHLLINACLGHCFSYMRASPFAPVLELVKQCCAINNDDDEASVWNKMKHCLRAAGIHDDLMAAQLAELLGISGPSTISRHLSPQTRRERMLESVVRMMLTVPPGQTRVIAIEDLHWLDDSSSEWLRRSVRQVPNSAILMILTQRPNVAHDWLDHSWVNKIPLPRLTQTESLGLVKSLPPSKQLANDLIEEITRKAEGHPFFLEELVWSTQEPAHRSGWSNIPNSIQGVLSERIDQLLPSDRRLLQTAAVIGVAGANSLLGAVADLDPEKMSESLVRLQSGEFLFQTYADGEPAFRFKHLLTQEVAYRSLLATPRSRLHRQIAEWLQHRVSRDSADRPEILARHFSAAGVFDLAAGYCRDAARAAYERSANQEAIAHAQTGLESIRSMPDGEQRNRLELDLQLILASALMVSRGYAAPEVELPWKRAEKLCSLVADDERLFRVLVGLWNFYWVAGAFDKAAQTARRSLELADIGADETKRLRAHASAGESLFHQADFNAARGHLELSAQIHGTTRVPSFAAEVASVPGHCYLGWTLWHQGLPDQALDRADRGLALARGISHPLSLCVALCLVAELRQFRQEPGPMLALTEQAIELAREQRFPFWEGTALINCGWAHAMLGRPSQGVETLQKGLEIFRSTGARVQLSAWYGMLAEAHGCAGQRLEALQAVDDALAWVAKTGESYYESELHRLRAALTQDGQAPNRKKAERPLRRALEVAHRQGAKVRELRAATDLGRLWCDQGRAVNASALLRPLRDAFTEGGDTPDLQRADLLLAGCPVPT